METASGSFSNKVVGSFVVQLQEYKLSQRKLWLCTAEMLSKGSLFAFHYNLAFTSPQPTVTSISVISLSYTNPDLQLHTEHFNLDRLLPSVLARHDQLEFLFFVIRFFFKFLWVFAGLIIVSSTENSTRNWILRFSSHHYCQTA